MGRHIDAIASSGGAIDARDLGVWSAGSAGTLVAAFARAARAHGGRIALESGDARLTYAQLDAMSDALAAGIVRFGAGAGDRVAVLMPHDLAQIVAMLGVLKAGRIVVVLDPGHPEARLRAIVEDAGPCLIVADAARAPLAGRVAGAAACAPYESLIAANPDGLPAPGITAEDTAALVYTSGTTGRPKAVMQTHGHVGHTAVRLSRTMDLGHTDRVALLASLGGAQGLCTTWQALIAGAALLPFATMERGVIGLAQWLAERRISVSVSSASLLRRFMSTLDADARFAGMRVLRVASEMATAADVRAFARHFPAGCRFVHSLAASEVGAIACHSFAPGDPVADGRLPVGRPLDGLTVRLLDDDGRAAPVGAVGEIVVEAPAMAAGYWGNPALTAARFSRTADGLYRFRTGDLGRFDPQGVLTVAGRRDDRVKIRGNTVELSEVEAALVKLPEVAQCFVCAAERPGRGLQLIGYLVMRPGAAASQTALRRALRQVLPAFMIPAALIAVDGLPLTASGKVDRERLLREHPAPRDGSAIAGPRTPTEVSLARIWAAALDVDAVSRDDDFFALGGDSLLAAVVAARAHEALGAEIGLGAFIDHPTVAALASHIDSRIGTRDAGAAPLRGNARRPQRAPLSFAQERVWRYCRTAGQPSGYRVAMTYIVSGPLDVAALRAAIADLFARHEILRTTFEAAAGAPVQIVHPPAAPDVPLHDCSAGVDCEAAAERLASEHAAAPLDLARLPVTRFALVRLRADLHWLLLRSHHLVADGESWTVCLQELARFYDAHCRAEAPDLAARAPVQYTDYVRWQRETLQRDAPAYRDMLAWWRDRLAKAPPGTVPPFKRRRPLAGLDPKPGYQRRAVDPAAMLRLDAAAARAGATPFMAGLAVFAATLAAETEQAEIVIGTYIANRGQAALRGLVGFLTNLVTLRIAVDRAGSFLDLTAAVRAGVASAEANAHIPYEVLREELRRERVELPEIGCIYQASAGHPPAQFGAARVTMRARQRRGMPWGFTAALGHLLGEPHFDMVFDAGLYDPEAIAGMLARTVRLLDLAGRDPEATVRALLAQARQPA